MKPSNLKLAPKVTAYQASQEALGRHRLPESSGSITVREGAGMAYLPSWFRFWWEQEVIKPAVGEIQQRLYPR